MGRSGLGEVGFGDGVGLAAEEVVGVEGSGFLLGSGLRGEIVAALAQLAVQKDVCRGI